MFLDLGTQRRSSENRVLLLQNDLMYTSTIWYHVLWSINSEIQFESSLLHVSFNNEQHAFSNLNSILNFWLQMQS